MKNKLLIKKYYFCKRKVDAAMTLINYIVSLKRLYQSQLRIVNYELKQAPIVQRIERKFPKL